MAIFPSLRPLPSCRALYEVHGHAQHTVRQLQVRRIGSGCPAAHSFLVYCNQHRVLCILCPKCCHIRYHGPIAKPLYLLHAVIVGLPCPCSVYGQFAIFIFSAWAGTANGGVIAGLAICGVVVAAVSQAAVLMQVRPAALPRQRPC
jgi:hypothetical protein